MDKENKTKLLVFDIDIDGTLTDSVSIHQEAFSYSLTQFGLSNFNTNWGDYLHHTDNFIFKNILEEKLNRNITTKDIANFESLIINFIQERTLQNKIVEIKGARKFLNEITTHSNYKIVFATGSLMKPALLKLDQANIIISDELVIASNEIQSREDIVLKYIESAKQFYNIEEFEHFFSFGDGRWDLQTAKNLNIAFIGINNPKLIEFGATTLYNNFSEISLTQL